MMTPSKAFFYYHGLHLHFASEKYSILKYGPDTELARTKFKALTDSYKFRFQWAAKRFDKTQDLVYAILAAELKDVDVKFDNKQTIIEHYHDFKSRRESLSTVLKSEFNKYTDRNEFKFHHLIFNYLAGIYSPEFVLLLDHSHDNLQKILKLDSFAFARPKILKIIKYKDFFNPAKYLHIINHEEPISA